MDQASPRLSPGEIAHFAKLTSDYVRSQRDRFYASGQTIEEVHVETLQTFFPLQLLREVRVAQAVRVPDPPFYGDLKRIGISNLPSFSDMSAVTFIDVLAFQDKLTVSILFHELVHALQYRFLGADAFANLYVSGFLKSGSYDGVPLEINAYQLQGRFDANRAQPFSVEAEVERWASEKRF